MVYLYVVAYMWSYEEFKHTLKDVVQITLYTNKVICMYLIYKNKHQFA